MESTRRIRWAGLALILCLFGFLLPARGQDPRLTEWHNVAANQILTLTEPTTDLPSIVTQPADQTNLLGTDATFCVTASGAPPLSYQWRDYVTGANFADIPDATNACLVLTNVQPTLHRFGVVVSNSSGSVVSRLAKLTVLAPPTIVVQPASATVEAGQTYTNGVAASGTEPLSYQWYFVADGTTTTNLLVGKTAKTLSIANIQFTNAGDYSVVVTNLYGSATSAVASLTVKPATFVKITTGAIVTDREASVGGSWCDYDGDGFQDLFVVNGWQYRSAKNSLYHNNGDGNFTKITTNALSETSNWWMSGAWADVDNDGDPDLYVGGADTDRQGVFYRNDGGGRFTAVSIVPTQDAASRDSRIVSWGDYDQDGWVDLFMPGITRPGNNHLFRNLGDLNFKSMTPAEVGDLVAPTVSETGIKANWIDYDSDGDLDIYLWQDPFALYLNSGSGFFTRTFTGSIANAPDQAGVPSWADYDNDGYLDVFMPRPIGDGINALHHNLNGTNSVEVTQAAGLDRPMTSMAASWGDYDNDGNLDLFVVNPLNWITPILRSANMLYRGNGDGTFSEVDVGSPIWEPSDDWEPCWVDYDNDGFLDLFIAAGGYSPEVNYLYRNNLPAAGNTNHWLKVSLVGKASNASGIGAKVRVTANIRGQTVTQLRAIEAPGGEGSNQGLLAHFGLGDATNVTTLRIEWPSGHVTEIHNVAANQFLTIEEPPGLKFAGWDGIAMRIAITGKIGERYDLKTSSNVAAPDGEWSLWQTVTNTSRTITVTDPTTNAPQRFYKATPAK